MKENTAGVGSLEAITGPMFSGKTGELIDQIEREEYADRTAIVIKPANDNRYSAENVVTHSGKEISAFRINQADPILALKLVEDLEKKGQKIDIVAFDEAQFFAPEIVETAETLVGMGKTVIIAGLGTDFRDEGFGQMPTLIAKADIIVQKFAKCTFRDTVGKVCGATATKTQRIVRSEEVVLIGGKDEYEARCRQHHNVSPTKD